MRYVRRVGMDRRQALRHGLGLGAGLGLAALVCASGCSVSDPRIEPASRNSPAASPPAGGRGSPGPTAPKPTPAPEPSPTFAGAAAAAEAERRLAGLAMAALDGPWRRELGDRTAMLRAVRDAHLAHAAVLLGPEPTARASGTSTTPITPHKAPTTLSAAMDRLAVAERAEAGRTRVSALATTGFAALLWAAISLAGSTYAAALEGGLASGKATPFRKPKPVRAMPLLSDVEAMQTLVEQLHAVNYGYPMAIGQLVDGRRRNVAIRALRSHRILRDSLVTTLQSRKAEIPVAEPAYVPSVFPRSDPTAAQLVQNLESRLVPFVGLWLASVPTQPERGRAFEALTATVTAARFWGAPLRTWPGWSS